MLEAATSPHLSAVSFVSNFNDLETLVLQHPAACDLYKQYLTSTCIDGRKAHHVDFFSAITHLEEQEWLLVQRPKRSRATEEKFQRELMGVYEKYFLLSSAWLLDISEECLEKVRENLQQHINVKAFHPAIRVVVRDLAFVHFESFTQSPTFKDYKEKSSHASIIEQNTPQEKESTSKVSHFFVQKALRDKNEWRRKSLDQQPGHAKEYRTQRKFSVGSEKEKASLLDDADEIDVEERVDSSLVSRRDRRLHVFFGDYFEIDDILFSERTQAQDGTVQEYKKQPTHVNTYRLRKFFGTTPPTKNEQGEYEAALAIHSKTAHLNRFFGERIDPEKEATSVAFAAQPINVRTYKLKKIFGESAAHTISFGGTWPRSRAKLEKIFGPFDG